MPKPTYASKLKDPRWQKRRLELLQAADWTCKECHSKSDTLHVHHGYYKRNTEPWDYPDEVMHVVCEACHQEMQEFLEQLHREIAEFGKFDLFITTELLSLLRGDKARASIIDLLQCVVSAGIEGESRPSSRLRFDNFAWIQHAILRATANHATDEGFEDKPA